VIAPPLSGNVLGSINDAFVVAEWRDAGGFAGPPRYITPLHVHHADDEAWYVLEGTLRALVGKDEVEAHAGSGVFVPRGTVHTYWNPGAGTGSLLADHDVEYLSLDSRNSRDAKPYAGYSSSGVQEIRFGASGVIGPD
jgi:mannose-6-phosphate isomerase-like protein (cupin superfamily)